MIPGHPSITIGGCIGFDVHGKRGACFRSCVEDLVVFHPETGELRCSPEEESELYDLTLGGFGLTGFVTSVTLQLVPLPGRSLRRRRLPVRSLHEAVEVMSQLGDSHPFLYSWHDVTKPGPGFGRGVVYAERFDLASLPDGEIGRRLTAESRRSLGRIALLNRHTVRTANAAYHALETRRGEDRVSLKRGSFPMASRELYFLLFGSRGFREYQLLVPRSRFADTVEAIEAAIHDLRARCSLASLKLLDGEPGMLRFSATGVAIALDVPADESSTPLFAAFDGVARQMGGVVNLSKDSRLSENLVRELFPGYEAFRSGVRSLGAGRAFDSALRRRVLA